MRLHAPLLKNMCQHLKQSCHVCGPPLLSCMHHMHHTTTPIAQAAARQAHPTTQLGAYSLDGTALISARQGLYTYAWRRCAEGKVHTRPSNMHVSLREASPVVVSTVSAKPVSGQMVSSIAKKGNFLPGSQKRLRSMLYADSARATGSCTTPHHPERHAVHTAQSTAPHQQARLQSARHSCSLHGGRHVRFPSDFRYQAPQRR